MRLVDRAGKAVTLPQVTVADDGLHLTSTGEWQHTRLGCGDVFFEGDFTVTLNLGALDEGSTGAITLSSIGPCSEVEVVKFTVGPDAQTSINAALVTAMVDWLTPYGWAVEAL